MQEVAANISFAPIGLVNMFNSGGAIEQFEYEAASNKPQHLDGDVSSELNVPVSENRFPSAKVMLKVRGCGRFGAYSSECPLKCNLDGAETNFDYEDSSGLVTLNIPVPQEDMYRWTIEILV